MFALETRCDLEQRGLSRVCTGTGQWAGVSERRNSPNPIPYEQLQLHFAVVPEGQKLPHFPRGSEWMRRLLDITLVPPYLYKILLRESNWEAILECPAAVTFGCPATMKFSSRWLNMVSFKACKSVESLEKPAQLVLLICRSRQ